MFVHWRCVAKRLEAFLTVFSEEVMHTCGWTVVMRSLFEEAHLQAVLFVPLVERKMLWTMMTMMMTKTTWLVSVVQIREKLIDEDANNEMQLSSKVSCMSS